MKELSLAERLMRYMQKNHSEWISSGELQRIVVQYTKHTPRSAVRRLQELAEEGKLERKLIKNHTWYRYATTNANPVIPQRVNVFTPHQSALI